MGQTDIAKAKPKTIQGMLVAYKDQITAALPRHMTPDRMARLALTVIRKNPMLAKADPVSLFGAIIQASQLGLEPGIHAHLVPFKNNTLKIIEVQMIADYRGLMALARRSKKITRFNASVVRENDKFEYELGSNENLFHRPAQKNRGDIIGAYAIAWFDDPIIPAQFRYMPKEDIDKIRKRSKMGDKGPWVTDYEAMAMKTPVRQLCKFLPVSIELDEAVRMDELNDAGINQGNAALIDAEYVVEDQAGEFEPVQQPKATKPNANNKDAKEDKQENKMTISGSHEKMIRKKLDATGISAKALCEGFNISKLSEMAVGDLNEAFKWMDEQ